jgi:hypothetical protein
MLSPHGQRLGAGDKWLEKVYSFMTAMSFKVSFWSRIGSEKL